MTKIIYDFKKEIYLARRFEKVVLNVIPSISTRNHITLNEVDTKRGIADIICAIFEKSDLDAIDTQILSEALGEISKAHIISYLTKKAGHDLEFLKSVTGLSAKTLSKHIKTLIGNGLISRTSKGSFRLTSMFSLPKIEIWAFELKLSNWKRAYYQAVRYRGFANNVSIVMPSDKLAHLDEKKVLLSKMGIGLISMNEEGRAEIIVKAKRGKPLSNVHYLYCLSKILKQYSRSYT